MSVAAKLQPMAGDTEERELLREWMRRVMDMTSWSAKAWADKAGTSPSNITRFMRLDNAPFPKPDTIRRLAKVAPHQASEGLELEQQLAVLPIHASALQIEKQDKYDPSWLADPEDLPILGTAAGSTEGVLIFPSDHPHYGKTKRPPQLRGVADGFAVICVGESMHPMYKPGQYVLIHPHEAILRGHGVLAEFHDDTAIIKEFVSLTRTTLTVLEYRPKERNLTFSRRSIRRLYRALGAIDR